MSKRESSFEMLRMVCIAFIIAFHYVYKGGFDFGDQVTCNKIIVDVIYHFGELGVNCFLLISGYFFDVTNFKWKKVGLIIFQTWIYLMIGRSYYILTGRAPWNLWGIQSYLFPVLKGYYWFVNAYVLIYILTPYIKKFILSLSQKEFQRLLLIQIFIWSIYPTFILGAEGINDTEIMPYYSRYIWLMVVYLIGAYIKLYGIKIIRSLKSAVIFEGIVALVLLGYILISEYHPSALGGRPATYFWPPNSFLQLLFSVGLFMIFRFLKIGYHKFVNYTASCTLGIYMLHDGSLSEFWWNQVFQNSTHQTENTLILHIAAAVVILIAAGVILESLIKIIEKPVIWMFTVLENKIASITSKLTQS